MNCVLYVVVLVAGIRHSSAFLISFNPSDLSSILGPPGLQSSNSVFNSDESENEDDINTLAMRELQEQRNKKLVQDFYQEVLVDRNVDSAYKYLSAETYIQHNPDLPDGREAIIAVFRKLHSPIEIHHIGADGDIVYVHSNIPGLPDRSNNTVMDIYKIENQKIVEHWDVIQNYKFFANAHPFF